MPVAAINPYSVDEDRGVVTGGFETPFSLEDINERLPDGEQVAKVHECDCGNRSYGTTIETGDKWHLRWCVSCGGVYGWHDARADYL